VWIDKGIVPAMSQFNGDEQEKESTKHETRDPKQTQRTNRERTRTKAALHRFEFSSSDFGPCFGFRASDFEFLPTLAVGTTDQNPR
jgi:hypothetical protein